MLQTGIISKKSVALLAIALSAAEVVSEETPRAHADQSDSSDAENITTHSKYFEAVNISATGNQLSGAANTYLETALRVQWSSSQHNPAGIAETVADLSKIRLGSRGDQVYQLQSLLNKQGFQVPLNGVFEAATYRQLVLFQAINGLESNGILSPQTITALQTFQQPPPTPKPEPDLSAGVLKPGSRGALVTEVQRRLVYGGFALEIDGIFGPQTYQAVVEFQANRGLHPDGIVGFKTAQALQVITA